MTKFFKIGLFIYFIAGLTAGRELVVLGFDDQSAPSVEKSFDRLFREKLSVTSGIQLTDYVECQKYRRLINFDKYPVVSKEQLEPIAKYIQDTAYFVWGTVNEFKIAPKRHYFFLAQLKGELTITLNIYSLSERKISYSGTIDATIYENKGLVFFAPLSRSVHVSALDQTSILEKLEYEAVRKSSQVISAMIRADIEQNGNNSDTGKQNQKAVNEVLSAPSVAAPEAAKQDSTKTPVTEQISKKESSNANATVQSTSNK